MDLDKLRIQIDAIDREIVKLFEKRMQVSESIARYKIETGKPVLDEERERRKIESVRSMAEDECNQAAVEELFKQIMALSRMRQYDLINDKKEEN